MISINKIEEFCETFQNDHQEIRNTLLLVDHEDYTKFVKGQKHNPNQAILIAVLPSSNLDFKNKDNFRFINYLHFFIVQKIDEKDGYERYVKAFKTCQPIMMEFFKYIHGKTDNFDECLFKYFDLSKLGIDPVTDLVRTYGYSLSIPLKTSLI